jgi:hypothetical protein
MRQEEYKIIREKRDKVLPYLQVQVGVSSYDL